MRPLMTAAIAALLLGPAYGQSGQPQVGVPVGTPSKNREEKLKLNAKEIDAEYEAAMKRSRATTPKVVSDPWQDVRTPNGKK